MLRLLAPRTALLLISFWTGAVAAAELIAEDFSDDGTPTLGVMQAVSLASDADWAPGGFDEMRFAQANGYGADEASDDWLITPELDFTGLTDATLSFSTAKEFDGPDLEVLVATDYNGAPADVAGANWQPLSGFALSTGNYAVTPSGPVMLNAFLGETAHIAFRYISTGTGSGDGAAWQVSELRVTDDATGLSGGIAKDFVADFDNALVGENVTFSANAQNGTPPYTFEWRFGDGATASGAEVDHSYQNPSFYTLTLTITDDGGETLTIDDTVSVLAPSDAEVPTPAGDLRVASFNVALFGNSAGAMLDNLEDPDFAQAQRIAEIIQRVRPDVILLNEVDYEPGQAAIDALRENFLGIAHNDAEPISYPYAFVAPSNTGVASGLDLNNDGNTGGPDDAQGFGSFEGQYGMALLSRLPIMESGVRTFREFLWADMPDARLPADPEDADGNGSTESWYSPGELAALRLSSKSHWDVPIEVGDMVVHLLASHPTPPVFDGTEDRNGMRNADEIRFWADYVTPGEGDYIIDDAGVEGGLPEGTAFVVVGDLNADPDEGDGVPGAVDQILLAPTVQGDVAPASAGGAQFYDRDDTLPGSGGLRLDYAQPSSAGLRVEQSGVFWPGERNPLRRLVGMAGSVSSDHRLVWVDLSTRSADDDGGGDGDDDDGDIGGESGDSGGAAGLSLLLAVLGLLAVRRARGA